MIWFVSQAVAGILVMEEELQEMCVDEGYCFQVVGEVIDASCLSVQEDQMGAIVTNYEASVEVLEDVHGLGLGTEFVLRTTNYDYSNAEDSPGCYDTDPGHPVGEISRFYLSPDGTDGVYSLYAAGAYYPTEDSNPSALPECPSLNDDEDDMNNDSEEEMEKGCSTVSDSPISPLLSLFFIALAWRQRR
jgi:hypothetical protein